jgi:hypothetical protein
MRVIYKYLITPGNVFHGEGNLVHFGPDGEDRLCLWLEINEVEAGNLPRSFTVLGTGQAIADGWQHEMSCREGPYIWHAYSKASEG